MLDFIRYLLERNAKEVSSKASRSCCVVHRTGTLRGIIDQNPDARDNCAQADHPQTASTAATQSEPAKNPVKKKS